MTKTSTTESPPTAASASAPPQTEVDSTDTTDTSTGPAAMLQSQCAAVRLTVRWLGIRRSLSGEQKQRAAESFGAEAPYLSAAKKLLDTRHDAYRAVTAIRNEARAYWKRISLPYPEPGVRLIRRDQVDAFEQQMQRYVDQLDEATRELDRHYDQLKADARVRLGELFNDADYPASLNGLFAFEWDYPAVQPPDYLMRLNPVLYEKQQQRIAARFQQAVELAEQAFVAEFEKLVSHLRERLAGDDDGKPKVFRDSAVENLRQFFDRFQQLNVRSNAQLNQLVDQARAMVAGVEPQQLRDSETLRNRVAAELGEVGQHLEGLMPDRPRRRILRPGKGRAA